MNKEEVMELYEQYEKADYKYHKYVDQFFTITFNGEVTQQATKGINAKHGEEIQKLDKMAHEAKVAYDEALHKWAETLK